MSRHDAAASSSRGLRAALASIALLAAAQPAVAQTPALEGRVIRGLDGDAVPGVRVELHEVTATGGAIVDSSVAGPDGVFRFEYPATEGRPLFLAAARHQGVRYFGPALHAGMTPDAAYVVGVYDTLQVSAPPLDLAVASRHVVVSPLPGGGLEVAEVIDIRGREDRTLVPASDTLALWSAALPMGATGVQAIEGGGATGAIEFVGGRVLLRSMIAPIGVRLSYTYRLDGDALRVAIEHPTDRIDLVVAGTDAEVRGVSHAETTTREGRLIHRYEGGGLETGAVVSVRLASPAPTDRWVWIWMAIGAGCLLAAGALWWWR